jgi:hypothetical protein
VPRSGGKLPRRRRRKVRGATMVNEINDDEISRNGGGFLRIVKPIG